MSCAVVYVPGVALGSFWNLDSLRSCSNSILADMLALFSFHPSALFFAEFVSGRFVLVLPRFDRLAVSELFRAVSPSFRGRSPGDSFLTRCRVICDHSLLSDRPTSLIGERCCE